MSSISLCCNKFQSTPQRNERTVHSANTTTSSAFCDMKVNEIRHAWNIMHPQNIPVMLMLQQMCRTNATHDHVHSTQHNNCSLDLKCKNATPTRYTCHQSVKWKMLLKGYIETCAAQTVETVPSFATHCRNNLLSLPHDSCVSAPDTP